MTEILPGIIQLKVPIPHNPLGFTNVYLVGGEGSYLLIDAGFDSEEALAALQKQLDEARVGVKQISQIIVTHGHGDHIGLAGRVRELSGAPLALHRLEARQPVPRPQRPDDFARLNAEWSRASGMPEERLPEASRGHNRRPAGMPSSPPPQADILLDDGQEIVRSGVGLRVIWTPGHSPGHICLYDAGRRVFFSADHVLPVTTPNIGLRPWANGRGQPESNPLGDYLASLEKVRDLDVELVLPAHEHAFHDLRARAGEIVKHHERRNDEIVSALGNGPKTAYGVSELITWMPESGGVKFRDLAGWDRRMAVSETIAHLQALRVAGTVARYAVDGVVYYRLTGG